VSADQFSTVVDKEKYFCDNDTSNVDTEAEEMTATGRPKRHAECVLFIHTHYTVSHKKVDPKTNNYNSVKTRLRPIPEFTDTEYRYR